MTHCILTMLYALYLCPSDEDPQAQRRLARPSEMGIQHMPELLESFSGAG